MLGRIETTGNDVRLQLQGAMDLAGAVALRDGFASLANASRGNVVLDFAAVSFIDGAGVGAVAFLFKRLMGRGRRLMVTGAEGQPLAMLRDLGLSEVLRLAPPARRGLAFRWAQGTAGA